MEPSGDLQAASPAVAIGFFSHPSPIPRGTIAEIGLADPALLSLARYWLIPSGSCCVLRARASLPNTDEILLAGSTSQRTCQTVRCIPQGVLGQRSSLF